MQPLPPSSASASHRPAWIRGANPSSGRAGAHAVCDPGPVCPLWGTQFSPLCKDSWTLAWPRRDPKQDCGSRGSSSVLGVDIIHLFTRFKSVSPSPLRPAALAGRRPVLPARPAHTGAEAGRTAPGCTSRRCPPEMEPRAQRPVQQHLRRTSVWCLGSHPRWALSVSASVSVSVTMMAPAPLGRNNNIISEIHSTTPDTGILGPETLDRWLRGAQHTSHSDQAQEGRSCTALRHFGGPSLSSGHPLSSQFPVTPLQAGGRVHWVSCRPWKTLFLGAAALGPRCPQALGPVPPCVSLTALALVL